MDPILNAVNVCSTKSTNKLRHFKIFQLFILFKEHSHYLNQAITKSNHLEVPIHLINFNQAITKSNYLELLACNAGVFFERAICSRKRHVETSRREEEI